jgi:2,4-dienoyl-CoA reductase-like NADH-dependent reductase (Old Yellow Enzyme family)
MSVVMMEFNMSCTPSLKTDDLFEPLTLTHGRSLKNRFALAPLTNTQSGADGILSNDEHRWLTMRARGGFGMVMTAAAHVQVAGQGYHGQLGTFDDRQLPRLTQLATDIKAAGSVACLQLAHSGRQALQTVGRVGPTDDAESGARALRSDEVDALIGDFVAAAMRGQKAGFDGVEIHAAHGFLPTQFLSPQINHRDDCWGGSLENRARLIFAMLTGIRAAARPDFQLGLRLSPERFGLQFAEVLEVARQAMRSGLIDWLDLSIWDVAKEPEDPAFRGRSVMSWFTELDRAKTRIGAAGKIMGAQDAARCLEQGADFVLIGRGAVLAHNFPERVEADPDYQSPARPVSADYLRTEGLGEAFIDYMRAFPGFVADVGKTANKGAGQ